MASCKKCKRIPRSNAVMLQCNICLKSYHDTCFDITDGIKTLCNDCNAKKIKIKKANKKNNTKNSTTDDSIALEKSHNITNNSSLKGKTPNSSLKDKTPTPKIDTEKMSPAASTPSVATPKIDAEKMSPAASTPSVAESGIPDVFSDTLGLPHHCSLPGSMLDLFSKQFELVTRSIDALQALVRNRVNEDYIGPIASPTKVSDDVLSVQVSQLEKKIDLQSAKLEELHQDSLALLHENSILKDEIRKLSNNMEALYKNNSHRNSEIYNSVDSPADESRVMVSLRDVESSSSSRQVHTKTITVPSRGGNDKTINNDHFDAKRTELIVSGIVDCTLAEIDPVEVAYIILGTVLPSITKEDIVSVRQSAPLGRRYKSTRTLSTAAVSGTNTKRPPPLIIDLTNIEKLEEVMQAKASFTRFNTSDIDLSRLSDKFANHLYHTNIYINEALGPSVYNEFKSLKILAKRIGFKFVWHRRGKFFARLKEGKSATDLDVIIKSHVNNSNSSQHTSKNIHNTNRCNNTSKPNSSHAQGASCNASINTESASA